MALKKLLVIVYYVQPQSQGLVLQRRLAQGRQFFQKQDLLAGAIGTLFLVTPQAERNQRPWLWPFWGLWTPSGKLGFQAPRSFGFRPHDRQHASRLCRMLCAAGH